MNIPDNAVEAAANAMVSASPDLSGWGDLNQAEIEWYMRDAREALEAAAPFIAAQALRDASDALDSWHSESLDGGPWDSGFLHASDMVRDRAKDLDTR